jgi:hypothetical protein
MIILEKRAVIVLLISLLSIPLIASVILNPYSYLSKPPITTSISVSPDKAMYDRNDIINFKVIITLDTLKTQKDRQYKVVIGNIGDLLVSSQLIKSDVQGSYDMNFEQYVVKLNFTVQMLQDDTPPNLKVEIIRLANTNSTTIRQYHGFTIDQYEKLFITSPQYANSQK